ncbi:MAG: hypothetical protein ABRQ26_07015 [Syntrophomonadaceae bacterium]
MNFLKRQEGSMSLEGVIVLPFFIAFAVTLIILIRISIVQMALQSAVSETTKQIATHYYPMAIVYGKWQQTGLAQGIDKAMGYIDKAQAQVDEYGAMVPPILIDGTETKLDGSEVRISDWCDEQVNNAAKAAVSPLAEAAVKAVADPNVLNVDKITAKVVDIPDMGELSQSGYIAIEAEYEMALNIPFIHVEPIKIKKRAVERAWIGV